MKIQKVIHSSNSNPLYLDFWPIVSKVWKRFFNIEPILLYLNDNPDVNISSEFGPVVRINPLPNIPIELQTLWIRYWFPLTDPECVFMISDIDMIPLSKKYFVDNISNYSDDCYLHINPCIDTYGLIPSCYHIAKGKKFEQVLQLDDFFEKDITKVMNFDTSYSNGWFNDEKYATHKINEYLKSNNDLILIPRDGGQNGHRIDRSFWRYDSNLLKQQFYYDSHSIRPYTDFKEHIDSLCETLLGDLW